MTSCMPCSFGLLQHARSEADDDLTGLVVVTVVDRYIPLVTAACGTRVARKARTTMVGRGGDGSHLNRRVRPVLGDPLPRGQEPGGLAATGWETRTLARRLECSLVMAQWPADCASLNPSGPLVPVALPCLPILPVPSSVYCRFVAGSSRTPPALRCLRVGLATRS
jgi:hypothetical protein